MPNDIYPKNISDSVGAQFDTRKLFNVNCSSGIHAWPYIRGEGVVRMSNGLLSELFFYLKPNVSDSCKIKKKRYL